MPLKGHYSEDVTYQMMPCRDSETTENERKYHRKETEEEPEGTIILQKYHNNIVAYN